MALGVEIAATYLGRRYYAYGSRDLSVGIGQKEAYIML